MAGDAVWQLLVAGVLIAVLFGGFALLWLIREERRYTSFEDDIHKDIVSSQKTELVTTAQMRVVRALQQQRKEKTYGRR